MNPHMEQPSNSPHHHHHHHHIHCHHHRYHHLLPHSLPHTPHHHHHHHHHHFLQKPNTKFVPSCSITRPLQQNGQPSHQTQIMEDDDLQNFEEEEDEEPIFVMTDEWRDFFAKSEARRREAKKLANKQGRS